jgi:integrase
MTINFYLDSKLTKLNEKRVICFLRGIIPNKAIYLKTKLQISPKQWNPEQQVVRKSSNSMEYNSYLAQFKQEVSNAVTKYQNEHSFIEYESLKRFIFDNIHKEANTSKPSFFDVFDNYLEVKSVEFAKSTYQKNITLKKHLINFEKSFKYKLTFDSFDMKFYDDFLNYGLNHLRHTNNTIYKLIKQVKTFLYWANERGYHNNLCCRKYAIKEDETDSVALTMNELDTLYNLDLSKNAKLRHIRDVFCFACFTGARFSDISRIKFEDIVDDFWHLRTQKTRDVISIYLIPRAKEILNRYKSTNTPLPVISNQKSNIYLKELCMTAALDRQFRKSIYRGANREDLYQPVYDFVTTHTARRTFVTLSYEKGMSMEVIMKVMGHKDPKTSRKYLKLLNQAVEREMKMYWS